MMPMVCLSGKRGLHFFVTWFSGKRRLHDTCGIKYQASAVFMTPWVSDKGGFHDACGLVLSQARSP
jgi:hypothetical protein